jgi:FMN phosphatase YigB (HAD superfamily)
LALTGSSRGRTLRKAGGRSRSSILSNIMKYDLIIFDFHRTLTDDLLFSSFDDQYKEPIQDLIFRPPNKQVWEVEWMRGIKKTKDIVAYLSIELEISSEKVNEVLLDGLEKMTWNTGIWMFAQQVRAHCKTAIATINCDLFTDYVVPMQKLNEKFDVIINSSEEGILDKERLCSIAHQRIIPDAPLEKILLIDDSKDNIHAFQDMGGQGYLYTTDQEFERWRSQSPWLSTIG